MKRIDLNHVRKVLEAIDEAKKLGLDNIVLERKNGHLEICRLCGGNETCDGDVISLENGFGFPASDIRRIFTIGSITATFQKPSPQNVKEKIIEHFKNDGNDIIFAVTDDEGNSSVYRYEFEKLGDPEKIKPNHHTIIFQTGRFFYIENLKSINSVGKTLLN